MLCAISFAVSSYCSVNLQMMTWQSLQMSSFHCWALTWRVTFDFQSSVWVESFSNRFPAETQKGILKPYCHLREQYSKWRDVLTNIPSMTIVVVWCIRWNEIHPIIQTRGLSRFNFTPNWSDLCCPMMHFILDGTGGLVTLLSEQRTIRLLSNKNIQREYLWNIWWQPR